MRERDSGYIYSLHNSELPSVTRNFRVGAVMEPERGHSEVHSELPGETQNSELPSWIRNFRVLWDRNILEDTRGSPEFGTSELSPELPSSGR